MPALLEEKAIFIASSVYPLINSFPIFKDFSFAIYGFPNLDNPLYFTT
jgi:hypothetical protein